MGGGIISRDLSMEAGGGGWTGGGGCDGFSADVASLG